MAGRNAVQHHSFVQNLNRRVRRVERRSAAGFWEYAYGSFLISGGSPDRRAYALSEKLCREMSAGSMPTIVLTNSPELEMEMVGRMRAGTPGCLRVTSANYRNYHFFYQWRREEILSFFSRAANILDVDSNTDLSLYLSAFLEVMEFCRETGLPSLCTLADYPDADIARIGRNSGVPTETLNRIEQYAKGGENFRLLLQQMRGFLMNLTTEQCGTKYNLSASELDYDAAYIVNLSSTKPALLYAYFAIELQRLLARTNSVRVVFSEIPIERAGELRDVFLDYLTITRETGLSISNVSGTLSREDLEKFKVILLLLDRDFIDSNIEDIVRLMGIYDQSVPTVSGGRQTPFSLCTSTSYQTQLRQDQLRVHPQDLEGCEAVLCGASGRGIVIARHFL